MAATTKTTTTTGKVRFDLSGLSQGFPNSFPQHLSFHFSPLSLSLCCGSRLCSTFAKCNGKSLPTSPFFFAVLSTPWNCVATYRVLQLKAESALVRIVSRQMRNLNPCSKKEALECVPIKVRLRLCGFKCILKALPPPPLPHSPRQLVNRCE